MELLQRFQAFIQDEGLFHPGEPLLLAVSGGLDSVVLCTLCREAGYPFVIAHCNFHLRDGESDRDEAFVRQLAAGLGAEILVKSFDTEAYAAAEKLSIQEAARDLRYAWFQEEVRSARPGHPVWILTAHHADDNIETELMHFFRGTGIQGLRGMLPKQGRILRPLLPFRKAELLAFARDRGLQWVEDSSNESDKYSRNYFRRQLIPLVQKIYPAAEQNLLSNLSRFRDIEILYLQAVRQQQKKLMVQKGEEWHLPVLKLRKTAALPAILFEILRDFGFTAAQVKEAMALLDSETGRYIRSQSHRLLRNRNWLILAPLPAATMSLVVIEKEDRKLSFEGGELCIEKGPVSGFRLTADPLTATLDARSVRFPLLLRKWKTGDYFYPLGMKKKKKVARFLIDRKLSQTDKEKIWVLEMNKKILWVVGQRIDDRFKVTDGTRELLQISLKMGS